jgi:hypothetical protein
VRQRALARHIYAVTTDRHACSKRRPHRQCTYRPDEAYHRDSTDPGKAPSGQLRRPSSGGLGASRKSRAPTRQPDLQPCAAAVRFGLPRLLQPSIDATRSRGPAALRPAELLPGRRAQTPRSGFLSPAAAAGRHLRPCSATSRPCSGGRAARQAASSCMHRRGQTLPTARRPGGFEPFVPILRSDKVVSTCERRGTPRRARFHELNVDVGRT